jgi:hypothetical protein
LEVFRTFTFGFRNFIFGRSTALGGSNFCSSFFTTVKTTSIPASRKSPTWIKMLSATALGIPLTNFLSFSLMKNDFIILFFLNRKERRPSSVIKISIVNSKPTNKSS